MVINGIFNKIDIYNQNKIQEDKNTQLKKKDDVSNLKSSSDKVELSNEVKLLNNVIDNVKKQDVDRTDKIKELKEKISAGEYKINAEKIADKILQNEIDLFV